MREEIVNDFLKHGAAIIFSEIRPNVLRKLDRAGLLSRLGADNVLEALSVALNRARVLETAKQHHRRQVTTSQPT